MRRKVVLYGATIDYVAFVVVAVFWPSFLTFQENLYHTTSFECFCFSFQVKVSPRLASSVSLLRDLLPLSLSMAVFQVVRLLIRNKSIDIHESPTRTNRLFKLINQESSHLCCLSHLFQTFSLLSRCVSLEALCQLNGNKLPMLTNGTHSAAAPFYFKENSNTILPI